MRQTTYTCDRCRVTITGILARIDVDTGWRTDTLIPQQYGYDLCASCGEEVQRALVEALAKGRQP